MKPKLYALALAAGLACALAPAFAQDTSTITQLGTNGIAKIDQVGNFGTNDATITQNSGDANMATIRQTGLGSSTIPTSADATIIQGGGNTNFGFIDQHDSGRVSADIVQDGGNNQSTIVQANSDRAAISNTQTGLSNAAMFTQSNVFEGGISYDQTGDGNLVTVIQHDGGFLTANGTQTGTGNNAYIDQTGTRAIVETRQEGIANRLTVAQEGGGGDNSNISITQTTNFNVANVTQVGSGFTATVVQNVGDGNTATINQHF
jgi:hypothetical protein